MAGNHGIQFTPKTGTITLPLTGLIYLLFSYFLYVFCIYLTDVISKRFSLFSFLNRAADIKQHEHGPSTLSPALRKQTREKKPKCAWKELENKKEARTRGAGPPWRQTENYQRRQSFEIVYVQEQLVGKTCFSVYQQTKE